MFEEMVVSTSTNKKTNKPWTVVISMVFQVLFLAILILIPLIYTEALPKTLMSSILLAPPPHLAATSTAGRAGDSQTRAALDGRWKAGSAKSHPKDLKTIKEEPEPDMGGMAGGVPGGVAGGSAGGCAGWCNRWRGSSTAAAEDTTTEARHRWW